ncbi:hypothetical protein AZI86_11255 [Bdellovibrio bacteriovorus]|uniref:HAMP domain-containing protein n=1 Tax=Bdellovibrio bacteriovorus TaxID=959 RepID=A0A150WLF8_BDEBC|nr:hypothetical protein [Bdellovibrio bacteriovorus]KYG64774.1 hypothetical protein AZI86_11255 [Bdellovibrio bacteriovorus]
MDQKPHARRRLIVNREVQYDVLMYVGLFVMSLFMGQVAAGYLFVSQVEEVVGSMSAAEFLSRYKVSFLIYQTIPLAVCLLAGVFVFNRLTSRIAGPLYNARRVIRSIQEGTAKDPHIRLRENDYFKEEIDDINVILKKSG